MKKLKLIGLVMLPALAVALSSSAQKFSLNNLDTGELLSAGKDLVKAAKPMSDDEEIQLGRRVAARIAGTFGIWKDENWTERINVMGRTLALYSERPDLKYRFAILDTDDVNAYSAPGGYIFISRGMLKEVKSEGELAGVLAHELGHVAKKHVVKEIQKSNLWSAGAKIAVSASDLNAQEESLLNGLTDEAWKSLVVKGLSKEDEFEADRLAALNADKFGYDPYGIYNFIKRLAPEENKPGQNLKMLLGTHPKPSARLAELDKLYQKQGCPAGALPDFPERHDKFCAKHPVK